MGAERVVRISEDLAIRLIALLGELDGVADEMSTSQIDLANEAYELQRPLEQATTHRYRLLEDIWQYYDRSVVLAEGDVVECCPSQYSTNMLRIIKRVSDGLEPHMQYPRDKFEEAL